MQTESTEPDHVELLFEQLALGLPEQAIAGVVLVENLIEEP